MAISPVASQIAFNNANRTYQRGAQLLEQLSTGLRVNRAADDAAALAIGSRLNVEASSLRTAQANVSIGTSALQVGDGALARVSDLLTRAQTLAVQAGSGNLSDFERGLLDSEYQNIVQEVGRITGDTEFLGTKIVGADAGAQTTKVGSGIVPSEDNVTTTTSDASPGNIGQLTAQQITDIQSYGYDPGATLTTTQTLQGSSIATQNDANITLERLKNAQESIVTGRTEIGAGINRLDFASQNLGTAILNIQEAGSQQLNLNVAQGVSAYANTSNLLTASLATTALANRLRGATLNLFA